MKNIDILAFGEPLMELAETQEGGRKLYRPGFGGDTSNAVIAAARQGARTAYVSAVGDDAFGHDFLALWDREGVDRAAVAVSAAARTGIYFISYGPQGHLFTYYRAGSAASLVGPDALPPALVARARILLVSGISQAISPSCAEAGFAALDHARNVGTTICYDTNLRLKLWSKEAAREVIHAAVAKADIVKPSLEDAAILAERDDPDSICDFYLALGPKIVTLTMGEKGTLIATPEARRLIAPRKVAVVDATGAGDTFTGCFLSEWLAHGDPFRAGEYANTAAGLSTQGQGAVAPMPRRAEVEAALRNGVP